jgi:hypothetical protein
MRVGMMWMMVGMIWSREEEWPRLGCIFIRDMYSRFYGVTTVKSFFTEVSKRRRGYFFLYRGW